MPVDPNYEPPIDPLADTNPSLKMRPVAWQAPERNRSGRGRRLLGLLCLAGALLFTVASVVVLLWPGNTDPQIDAVAFAPTSETADNGPVETVVEQPSSEPEQIEIVEVRPASETSTLPALQGEQAVATLSPDRLAALLATPVTSFTTQDFDNDAFTIIPDRPRSEFVEYTVVRGDTIDAISRRFGLAQESIAWCNDRRIVFVLRPGDVLRIPPVDGVCHVVLGTLEKTIAQLASDYKITDPYQVIDSPYNPGLVGRSPNDVLPGGTTLFLPGGEGELITWNPGSDITRDASGNVVTVSFASGQAGSCGAVTPGGGAAWGNPLPNGTWVRGFYAGHTGIDLAAASGTPIFAANSGPVLFSGFSRYGYGETVVLAHGPFSTLYAHMNTRSVFCGQYVNVGQVVGLVGSTGDSSGPHLHFEIRFNDIPQDPSATPGIGW